MAIEPNHVLTVWAASTSGEPKAVVFTNRGREVALALLECWMRQRTADNWDDEHGEDDPSLTYLTMSGEVSDEIVVEMSYADVSEEPRYKTRPLRWVITVSGPEPRSFAYDAQDEDETIQAIRKFCRLLNRDGRHWSLNAAPTPPADTPTGPLSASEIDGLCEAGGFEQIGGFLSGCGFSSWQTPARRMVYTYYPMPEEREAVWFAEIVAAYPILAELSPEVARQAIRVISDRWREHIEPLFRRVDTLLYAGRLSHLGIRVQASISPTTFDQLFIFVPSEPGLPRLIAVVGGQGKWTGCMLYQDDGSGNPRPEALVDHQHTPEALTRGALAWYLGAMLDHQIAQLGPTQASNHTE